MNKAIILLSFVCLFFTACNDETNFEDHQLIGNYIGVWETNPLVDVKLSIDINEDDSGLIFYFSLLNTYDINVISDTEFTIDRCFDNSFSKAITGELVEDTLFLENDTYLVSDQANTQEIRKGQFIRQD